jgi:hypothetical protein
MKITIERREIFIHIASSREDLIFRAISIPGEPQSYVRRGWVAFEFPRIIAEEILQFKPLEKSLPSERSEIGVVELALIQKSGFGYLWRLNWNGKEKWMWIKDLNELNIQALLYIICRALFPADYPRVLGWDEKYPLVDFRKNPHEDLVF